MEPRVRYAITADGVSIAFWTLGEGTTLVYMTGGPWGHIELWDIPECRRCYERLAQERLLVRYDVRGTRYSERDVSDHSLDALVADAEAVIARLGLDRFAMFGAFAARHPERVSHLVLWCLWARSSEIRSPRIRAWRCFTPVHFVLLVGNRGDQAELVSVRRLILSRAFKTLLIAT